MKQVVCWAPERVAEVINIDADHVADEVFWAVDTETPLRASDGEDGAAYEQSTAEIVERMLDKKRGHYQLAVLGPAGAGKSHLIHRMHQEIKGRGGLEVLSIRRLETNLRAVLEKLIRQLPPGDQGRYLEDLQRAGPAMASPAAQKSTLLDSLAQAIEDDIVHGDSGIDPELEAALLDSLPSLLRDPYVRKIKFLQDGEVASELVDRLFSSREGKRVEERIEFERESLPFAGIDLRDCALQTRDAIEIYLYNSDQVVPCVLTVINRNLNAAIARALNFSGDQLGELLGRIRRSLKQRELELVILFEEFARLQGYDMAMLAALTVQGGAELCNVRWALACTTGRFRELPDTVRDRMDAVVNMDQLPARPDLGAFTGRYLNAVRLGAASLAEEYARPSRSLPNHCDTCGYRGECFEAFGATGEGYGLYPFTAKALTTLATRSSALEDDAFNPREFQKRILKPVLMDEASALSAGQFPTPRLLSQLGGPAITNLDRTRLQERAGAKFDQYLSFFQLWNGGRFAEASPEVMRTLGLEPLTSLMDSGGSSATGLISGSRSGPSAGAKDGTRSTPIQTTPVVDPDAAQISEWVDGGELDQSLAQRLRTSLFPLIERAIDWDALGLHQATFSGATTGGRPFRNQSIQFLRQRTTGGVGAPIKLELPLRRDAVGFAAAALALESLLKYEKSPDWEHASGLEGLAAVCELADQCAKEVSRQLLALSGGTKAWNPIAGTVELLLVGAALGGVINASQTTDETLVEAIFRPMPEENPYSDAKLRALYDRLKSKRSAQQSLVRAHVSASKGGRVGRAIDPRPVRDAARRLRREKWVLRQTPEARPEPYTDIGDTYSGVLRDLSPALEAERAERGAWLATVVEAFGDASKGQILEAASKTVEAATTSGTPAPSSRLDQARQAFATPLFDAAVRAVKAITQAEPAEAELLNYAKGGRAAVQATVTLIDAWNAFLAAAEADMALKRAEAGADELSGNLGRLHNAAEALCEELALLETSK